ncbi:hypothetical protein BX600DRAFT_163724 [Xylariales sp. PMI_506]|nr:hypothetical protein BX600DRAFT_163724 [Xylariales sp. PMI_506]
MVSMRAVPGALLIWIGIGVIYCVKGDTVGTALDCTLTQGAGLGSEPGTTCPELSRGVWRSMRSSGFGQDAGGPLRRMRLNLCTLVFNQMLLGRGEEYVSLLQNTNHSPLENQQKGYLTLGKKSCA